MLYTIEEDGGAGIKLKCRKCPYAEDSPALLYEHNLREDATARLVVNPYLTHDPTLPRFTTIQCPNEECQTRKGGAEPDVVALKIDPVNVVWMYQCAVCSTSWKQESGRG
jgi:hypothetical protein